MKTIRMTAISTEKKRSRIQERALKSPADFGAVSGAISGSEGINWSSMVASYPAPENYYNSPRRSGRAARNDHPHTGQILNSAYLRAVHDGRIRHAHRGEIDARLIVSMPEIGTYFLPAHRPRLVISIVALEIHFRADHLVV